VTQTHSLDQIRSTGFQYTPTPDGCSCPIHREGQPVTAPLGLGFAERVHIESIPRHVAGAIYEAHHSYMDDIPRTNLVHHGLCYQDQLLGAITWRYPLIRSLEYDGTRFEGDEIVEAARICIGVDFPNLASAALARSMERFVRRHGRRRGVRLLLTFVRADFDGSMIKALRDKGWHCAGKTDPGQAGNRPDKQIREQPKWRFLCEVPAESDREQASLGRWSP